MSTYSDLRTTCGTAVSASSAAGVISCAYQTASASKTKGESTEVGAASVGQVAAFADDAQATAAAAAEARLTAVRSLESLATDDALYKDLLNMADAGVAFLSNR